MKFLLLILLTVPILFADESPPKLDDAEFRDVAKELRCPTCTGLSVLESDAPFSQQIKGLVQDQMRAGKSKPEIISFFVERYGAWILREPPKQGFNALAWILPLAVMIGGPILIWLLVWRRRKTVPTFGVRGRNDIMVEMRRRLDEQRGSGPAVRS